MPIHLTRRRALATVGLVAATATALVVSSTVPSSAHPQRPTPNRSAQTASPIKHVVVFYDENVSYDHYFGTYPKAANTDGTKFVATTHTPKNNNLLTSGALTSNPNLYYPTRLTADQALTCDQNHSYLPEQKAENGGQMDKFVQNVSVDSCTGEYGAPGLSMDYYDGNTVTGMWNYAQQYAMSDASFDATFGPSTPGALNLISGQTHGFREVDSVTGQQVATPGTYTLAAPDKNGVGTVVNDPDPAFDDCSDSNHTSTNTLAAATGQNIGDLLNQRGVTWGWFQGGFAPTSPASPTQTYSVCGAKSTNIGGASVNDYSPHHNPFAYYASTSNPHHLPPSSVQNIGKTDQANHNYDISYFDKALNQGSLPAVSYLKAPEAQDGHAGYSDPIDEQHFLVSEINAIQKSKYWDSTAIVIAYDDSDGWYDHVAPKITNSSKTAIDDTICTQSTAKQAGDYADRCGPSQRLPLLVISPYAKTNYIGHSVVTQPSVLKFIEDNWFTGRVGDSSFDAMAGNLNNLFNFTESNNKRVILKPDGSVKSITPIRGGHVRSTS
ncbi:phospholipase C [Jatrophihabitans sp. GAS493]|uniref:phospholipase C n=1 Tax=Jatrophihabitans sp. GAS493 TaxID=1907575 RepID=UPI000BC08FA1|nr:alkaline phosphatase family protein [Jatrophihabitans sp. GAS493]SOD71691.1 phospholipase C [Jatrophihabitans sp. GAS493]